MTSIVGKLADNRNIYIIYINQGEFERYLESKKIV